MRERKDTHSRSHSQHAQEPADTWEAVTETMEPNSSLLGKMVKQHQTAIKCGLVHSGWTCGKFSWLEVGSVSLKCFSHRTCWMIVLLQVGGWDDTRRDPIKSAFLWLGGNIKNDITQLKSDNESLEDWLIESGVKLLLSLESQSCVMVQSWHLAWFCFARRAVNVCVTLHWCILWLNRSLWKEKKCSFFSETRWDWADRNSSHWDHLLEYVG